jgi:hypothetical protein
MPASALLKFTQGVTVGGDGRALVGVLSTAVNISNVNNSGVQSWQIDVAYADPTSAVAIATLAFNNASSTPAASFTPDVRRSFRIVLKVWDVPNRAGDPTSIDIRNFSVRELNGALVPPSMVWPLPLPDPRTGDPTAKPNEMNFDGQDFGWHGTGLDGLLSELLAKHMPPAPSNPGDVLTVVSGRWAGAPPSGGGAGDVSGPGAAVVADNIVTWNGTSGTSIKDSGLSLGAFIKKDGTVAFTGSQSMGGFKITSLANGVAASDAVNLGQVQSLINGLDPKGNVRAYSNTNVTLSGLGAFGGLGSLNDGDRTGLGGQTDPKENGIWVAHAGAWTRPSDFNTGMDVSGAYFIVEEGTFADREFLVTSDTGSAVVGTNNLTVQDFGSSTISAGNGLQKVGNVLSIMHDGATLSSSVSGLKVSTGGITGNELAVGAVDLSTTKVTGLLPFANIANGSAASLFGRSANSIGVMASIASSADGQVLRRAGGALAFGAVDLADTDAVTGLLPLANLASLTGLSVLGRAAATLGVMAAITGTADQVLAVNTAGTSLAFGQVQTAGLANSAVTLAKLANATASSVLGRSAATIGAYADIASTADGQVLRRGAAGVIAFGAIDLADTDAVSGLLPFSNIADGSATSVFGRAAGTVGVQASIAATADGQILQRVAGALTWATVAAGSIAGGTAVGQVLINTTGNVPAWGAVDLADADAVTGLLPFANLANLAGLSVLGRSASTAGAMAAITGAADQVLVVNSAGTALVFSTIATGGLSNSSVTLAKLANGTAASVIGRSAATGGPYADISSTADGQILRRLAGVVGWGAIDLSDTDAVSNQLAGSFVVPNFVAQNIITTGSLLLGTTPASSGNFRVPHGFTMNGFDSGGTLNRSIIQWGNTANTLVLGSTATGVATVLNGDTIAVGATTGPVTVSIASVAQLTVATNLVTLPTALSIGTNPASAGNIRLSNGGIIRGRNNANTADLDMLTTGSTDQIILGNSSDCSVLLNAQNVLLRPAGTDRVQVTDTVFEWRLATVRFDVAVASGTIQYELDSTAAVTGKTLSLIGQDVTGTGATIGGPVAIRAGNSTNGTGGGMDIRSGTGGTSTARGDFLLRIGSDIFLSMPGVNPLPTSGNLRMYHGATVLTGRDSLNATNAGLIRWGVTSNDLLTFGNSVYSTELLGASVSVGDGSAYLEIAVLATNREILSILLGSNISTTQMQAGTGDKVAFWADATTAPTAKPAGGSILYNSSTLGFASMSEGGVETTIVAHGSGTSRARKLVGISKQGSQTVTVAAGVSVVVTLSASDISAAAFAAGVALITIKAIARESAGSNYTYVLEARASVVLSASGFSAIRSGSFVALIGAVDNTVNEGPLWGLDVTTNVLRLTADASTRDMICFAVISVDGDTDA